MPKGYKGREKTERLHLLASPEEIQAIEDWQYKNRVSSKGEAIRRLIQIGLIADAGADRVAAITRKIAYSEMPDLGTAQVIDILAAAAAARGVADPIAELRKGGNVADAIAKANKANDDFKASLEGYSRFLNPDDESKALIDEVDSLRGRRAEPEDKK
jgi:hypothetical protein